MKINILSPGRFHVLDLARELQNNGFDVKFYSFVPSKRALSFGLPKECSKSLFILLLPFLALCRIFKEKQWPIMLRKIVQDWLTSLIMRPCDVVISMSGEFVRSNKIAKNRGSVIIIERGSKHILEQKLILESIPSNRGKKPVPDKNVERELKDYETADYVSIATEHVKRSFLKYGYPIEKLFVNPYGVDLSMFKPINVHKNYDVITVGAWSYQKGSDLILSAIKELGLQFLHVGSIKDVTFEEDDFCHHHEAVNQKELIHFYNQAKVFLLPSRQEGLAMVQAQALACNLPIIGSKDSGAEDIKSMVAKPEFVTIIESYDKESVKKALADSLSNYNLLKSELCVGKAIDNFSWSAYGKRYANFLNKL